MTDYRMANCGNATLIVRHNAEVAHRLSLTPGKCQQIHGHSMWITIECRGFVGETGMVADLDFGDVKQAFRHYVDTTYDHHLLLNENDSWAKVFPGKDITLPGASLFDGDPTTENIARWVAEWVRDFYFLRFTGVTVKVEETSVNAIEVTLNWPIGVDHYSYNELMRMESDDH